MHNKPIQTVAVVVSIAIHLVTAEHAVAQTNEEQIVDEAFALYDSAEYEAALKKLESVSLNSPANSAYALYIRGACYYHLDNYEKALLSLNASLKKDKDIVGNHYYKGYIFLNQDRYAEAAREFGLVLKNDPNKKGDIIQKVVLNYAYCLVETGQTEAAITYLKRYPKEDAGLLHALAFYVDKYTNDSEGAIAYWEEALKLDPRHKMSLENVSISYYELGDYNLAFFHVEKLIEFYPDYGRGYYLKGAYLEKTGEELDAIIYYTRARERGYDGEEEE